MVVVRRHHQAIRHRESQTHMLASAMPVERDPVVSVTSSVVSGPQRGRSSPMSGEGQRVIAGAVVNRDCQMTDRLRGYTTRTRSRVVRCQRRSLDPTARPTVGTRKWLKEALSRINWCTDDVTTLA